MYVICVAGFAAVLLLYHGSTLQHSNRHITTRSTMIYDDMNSAEHGLMLDVCLHFRHIPHFNAVAPMLRSRNARHSSRVPIWRDNILPLLVMASQVSMPHNVSVCLKFFFTLHRVSSSIFQNYQWHVCCTRQHYLIISKKEMGSKVASGEMAWSFKEENMATHTPTPTRKSWPTDVPWCSTPIRRQTPHAPNKYRRHTLQIQTKILHHTISDTGKDNPPPPAATLQEGNATAPDFPSLHNRCMAGNFVLLSSMHALLFPRWCVLSRREHERLRADYPHVLEGLVFRVHRHHPHPSHHL